MISNNIKNRLEQIKLYDTHGTQSMLSTEYLRRLIDTIPKKDLSNPAMTYFDPQCGTGTILLALANVLMDSLKESIPDEVKRLKHILSKQLFANDIDYTQYKLAVSNLKRAVNDKDFLVNVTNLDCFDIDVKTDYVISSVEFKTTNDFVTHFRDLSPNVIIVTRTNKHNYVDKKLNQVYSYQFLGIAKNSTPMAVFQFKDKKNKKDVIFVFGKNKIVLGNPNTIPGEEIVSYQFLEEVLSLNLPGYQASAGPERPIALINPGNIPMIYNVGKRREAFGDVIYVSKNIITERTGFGKNKVVVSKTGNRGKKSALKKAGPEYAVGANTYWIELSDRQANKFIKIWDEEPCYDKLICAILETKKCNGVKFWSMVPDIKYLTQIKEIYDKHYKS